MTNAKLKRMEFTVVAQKVNAAKDRAMLFIAVWLEFLGSLFLDWSMFWYHHGKWHDHCARMTTNADAYDKVNQWYAQLWADRMKTNAARQN